MQYEVKHKGGEFLNKIGLILLLFLVIIYLSGYEPSVHIDFVKRSGIPGFWSGLWHGFILPFTFVWRLFDANTEIYSAVNKGIAYDFGFLLGVLVLLGNGRRILPR